MQQLTKRVISLIAVAVMSMVGIPAVMAENSGSVAPRIPTEPLQIALVRSKVVLENGREVMQSAAIAKPDEILQEVATYTNTSKSALKNVEATLPIPANTELVVASVTPANAKASTDGKSFSKLPLTRKLQQSNGVEIEQAVPVADYRYLRWYPGELAPGKSATFSARFKVANSPSAPIDAGK